MSAIMEPEPAQLALDLAAAIEDVDVQRLLDRADKRRPTDGLIRARMRAVLDAAEHPDEAFALRQACVDLAAALEEKAAGLTRPVVPHKRCPRGHVLVRVGEKMVCGQGQCGGGWDE